MKKLVITYIQRQTFQLCCLSVFIVMITTLQTKANDVYVGNLSQGGVTLHSGKNSMIRMDSEYVEIRLYKEHYTVDATFWLYNTSKKVTIKVAFPQKHQGEGIVSFDASLYEETQNLHKEVV